MKTTVYMVRHAESPYTEGDERSRGLTPQGSEKAKRAAELLKDAGITVVASSPYARAILTVEPLAQAIGSKIEVDEDLRERLLAAEDYVIPNEEFTSTIENVFANPDLTLPGGESNTTAARRGVQAFQRLLDKHRGETIAVGTHGNIMTLIMQQYDAQYGLHFWKQTSKPDIYRMDFEQDALVHVTRLWTE
ncbi:histidine phosphatase family protein [Paenibacillus cremeus]|uniref:Histidine phosphatase family protein n=1 Tax=Paenibacillus cremeus TaxID=2163881 RepID=A0A559KDN8_9BACL|nr:histidine phosphatase family protein [Paenibacillus cremeus]TVY10223.1 histidine phosphatase family protein [Paenibacillus cremeus]